MGVISDALRVNYDDGPEDIIGKVNKLLGRLGSGYKLTDDGQTHDGFVVYHLEYPEPSGWEGLTSYEDMGR